MSELEAKLARAWAVRRAHFPDEITWSYPLDTAVLSLTGGQCALDCAHCGAHYLAHMAPVERALDDRHVRAATSLLVSGGSDSAGRVPLRPHLSTIRALASDPHPPRKVFCVGVVLRFDRSALFS